MTLAQYQKRVLKLRFDWGILKKKQQQKCSLREGDFMRCVQFQISYLAVEYFQGRKQADRPIYFRIYFGFISNNPATRPHSSSSCPSFRFIFQRGTLELFLRRSQCHCQVKRRVHSQLNWAILLYDVIPGGKNWANCAVLTGNSAGLRTVLSSRLSHRELRSSLRESHIFLSLPANTTTAHAQEETQNWPKKKLTNLMGNLCCAREHSVQFFAQFFFYTGKVHSLTLTAALKLCKKKGEEEEDKEEREKSWA